MRTTLGRGTPCRALFVSIAVAAVAAPATAQDMTHANHQPSTMNGVLGISMDRLGSGTTWIPDAVRLPSRHKDFGAWNVMLHAFVFAQYNLQQGPRGDEQAGSLNWAMLMASRRVAGGVFQARTMLSLDPWSVTARGYPLLLQTGETHDGVELFDRQHPHDFWMEVAAQYDRPIASNVALSIYAGPSGEPALGPVAFMHRVSAMDDPVAPLGHHWQDATHISYGVVTGGLITKRWKLEASSFNGREPDERRFAMDKPRLDSWSARVTVNPGARWSFTTGYGYLDSPEAAHPDESQRRMVASALFGTKLGESGQWASSFVWGANRMSGEWSHSQLLESEAILDRTNTVFGRAEVGHRTAEALTIPSVPANTEYRVGSVSLGYIRELARGARFTTGVGVRGTLNMVPGTLETEYGSRFPAGFLLFVRVRPVHGVTMEM